MITGYNTDIKHSDVVFHVQTEDKGSENPFIESLVYVGGRVLAAKRASYASLLSGGENEKAVVELMERQHRTVIAAIKNGRFDIKLEAMLGSKKVAPSAPANAAAVAGAPGGAVEPAGRQGDAEAASVQDAGERTLDQVILEYLTNEADQEQLLLTVDSQPDLDVGTGAEIHLRTTSSRSGRPVPGARVQVRMISTVADPQVLATGRTGEDGSLRLSFEIPRLERGTAALIISAASSVGNAEIKHLL